MKEDKGVDEICLKKMKKKARFELRQMYDGDVIALGGRINTSIINTGYENGRALWRLSGGNREKRC